MNSDKNLLPDLSLTNTETQALQKIKTIITTQFPVERMALFGSVVRGEADEESDEEYLTRVEVKFLQKGKLYVRNYQSNL